MFGREFLPPQENNISVQNTGKGYPVQKLYDRLARSDGYLSCDDLKVHFLEPVPSAPSLTNLPQTGFFLNNIICMEQLS